MIMPLYLKNFHKTDAIKAITLLGFFLVVFLSCSNNGIKNKKVRNIIENALNDSQGITVDEFSQILLVAKEVDQKCTEEDIRSEIKLLSDKLCKRRRDPICNPDLFLWGIPPVDESKKINVFLENSGSMFGYLNDTSQYKEFLMEAMTRFKLNDKEVNVAFVNDSIYPLQDKLGQFLEYLNPTFLSKKGNTKNSDLSKVVEMIFKRSAKEDDLTILVSDFIFSITKPADKAREQLATQKYAMANLVKDHNLKEQEKGILIVKCNSIFDGKYYTFENTKKSLTTSRPYYFWVIGPIEELLFFKKKYKIDELKGYDKSMLIYSPPKNHQSPYSSILRRSYRIGKFRSENKSGALNSISQVSSKRGKDGKMLQFSVAVDLSKVPLEENEKLQTSRYSLSSELGSQFEISKVISVKNADDLEETDKKLVQSATHIFVLKLRTNFFHLSSPSKLSIQMEKVSSSWYKDVSTLDDSDIFQDTSINREKTFGFEYIIDGLLIAFEPTDTAEDVYFKIDITFEP